MPAQRISSQKRRPLLFSRLARLIFFSNLAGLVILIIGATALNRFETELIASKVNNLQTQSALMASILGDTATGSGVAAALDESRAKATLGSIDMPDGWRARLHDRAGRLIADSAALGSEVAVSILPPLGSDDREEATNWSRLRAWIVGAHARVEHNLPWRVAERNRLRRDLTSDIRQTLQGRIVAGPAYTDDDQLVVSVSSPIRRVQNTLGVLTLESSDIADVVASEREALLPIIGIAFAVSILSSLAMTLSIALPIRRLARGAEVVARSSEKRDSIPDLSRRRDDIGDLSLRMREMSSGLYDRIDDVADFAADVAHEIKNPLTSLQSASDTLRIAKSEEHREKLIGIIQHDVGRMNRLISDISAASRVDAELARESVSTVDMAALAQGIVELYNSTGSRDAVEVRYFGPGEDTVFVKAFASPLTQVVRNIIDNAITFSPEGGEVRVTLEADEDTVVLAVSDDGPGIPDDALESVFQRFYTDRTMQENAFGSHSGLGLTICRQIVTAHNGRIHAENIGGGTRRLGARFVVELPRITRGGAPQRPTRYEKREARRGGVADRTPDSDALARQDR